MPWHQPPEGYKVSAYCRECGNDFAGETAFDRHKTGTHEYTYSEGVAFDPPVEDGRRCKSKEEMLESGLRPMTESEMTATRRNRHRAGFGVLLWFDPVAAEYVIARRESSEGLGQ